MDTELKREYDKQDSVSIKDIASDLYTPFLISHDREVIEKKLDLEVGQFLKVFNITPVAKYKEAKSRGKPSFLYPRKRTEQALTHLEEWMKKAG